MIRRALLAGLSLLAGCTTAFETPRNTVALDRDGYQLTRRPMQSAPENPIAGLDVYAEARRCADADLPLSAAPAVAVFPQDGAPPLSPGDMLRLTVAADEIFQGEFVIGPDGALRLPLLPPIPAAGFTLETTEAAIARHLVSGGFFQPGFLQIELDLAQWAPVQVHVGGAVFSPGDVVLNDRGADQVQGSRVDAGGDVVTGRSLVAAVSSAAGLRPDADIRNVVLIRNGRRRLYDLSGALTGAPFPDPQLAAGDQIHVPTRGCFQAALARPSRVTLTGIRVFLSNLTQPSPSNAQSAIGPHATSLPYGTRLLQALVSANCVGGVQATNANRWAVLISRNPVTGESEVIARSIEDLVRRADRDAFNPVLLPNDAIACYDSHFTNVRDVVSGLTGLISPATDMAVLSRGAR